MSRGGQHILLKVYRSRPAAVNAVLARPAPHAYTDRMREEKSQKNDLMGTMGVRYPYAVCGTFLARSDRFTARVMLEGQEIVAHLKTTGRCAELLVPGTAVVVCPAEGMHRRTAWDLVAAYKGDMLVNIDSLASNRIARQWLAQRSPGADIRPEVRVGDSRLDFVLRDGAGDLFVEVKGCTLEQGGQALFPDAPTQRGVKHLHALGALAAQGHRALVLFVVQMRPVTAFSPHDALHPAFGQALRRAAATGVEVHAVDCIVTPQGMHLGTEVPVRLQPPLHRVLRLL